MSAQDLFNVTGRIYAITGAGGALCGVMARELGARGARVALIDLDLSAAEKNAEEIRSGGGTALAIECNVLDAEQIQAALERIVDEWGVPDVLINGAGGNHPSGSTTKEFATPELLVESARAAEGGASPDKIREQLTFFDVPTEGFERVFDLNFMGTVLPTRIIGRAMAESGRGAVINMASMSSLTPLTKVGAYSAAKTAVAAITRWLSVHLAPVGVRVNALAPGFFMTEQLKFLHIDQETGELTPRAKAAVGHTPMGRYGQPEDLVGAVIWLSTEASAFVTGIVVPIDGGFSSYTV
jgi:NAD(P)-dependent dehydrogenase (short-subunit alcohol dehydrogenase family)